MALAHLIRLIKSFIRTAAETYREAAELRRLMSRRHPHIEEE
jgi:hypothetical protein